MNTWMTNRNPLRDLIFLWTLSLRALLSWPRLILYISSFFTIYIYICIYICVCVCVCIYISPLKLKCLYIYFFFFLSPLVSTDEISQNYPLSSATCWQKSKRSFPMGNSREITFVSRKQMLLNSGESFLETSKYKSFYHLDLWRMT